MSGGARHLELTGRDTYSIGYPWTCQCTQSWMLGFLPTAERIEQLPKQINSNDWQSLHEVVVVACSYEDSISLQRGPTTGLLRPRKHAVSLVKGLCIQTLPAKAQEYGVSAKCGILIMI
jgi:hypothetical protein